MAMSIGNPQFSAEELARRREVPVRYVAAMVDVPGTGPVYAPASLARGPKWSYSDMTEERRTKRVIRRSRTQ